MTLDINQAVSLFSQLPLLSPPLAFASYHCLRHIKALTPPLSTLGHHERLLRYTTDGRLELRLLVVQGPLLSVVSVVPPVVSLKYDWLLHFQGRIDGRALS